MDNFSASYGVFISVTAAIALWLSRWLIDSKSARVNRTIQIMLHLQTVAALDNAASFMALKIKDKHRYFDDDVSKEEDENIMALLNFYELISTYALEGFLDRHVVANLRGRAMHDAVDVCRGYIEARGKKLGRENELYCRVQQFATRYEKYRRV